MTAPLAMKICQWRDRVMETQTAPLTGVRTSNAVLGNVDKAVRIEGHVLDVPDGDFLFLSLLHGVSGV
jgi:hypothetical protein